jgi:hypothetical protein
MASRVGCETGVAAIRRKLAAPGRLLTCLGLRAPGAGAGDHFVTRAGVVVTPTTRLPGLP